MVEDKIGFALVMAGPVLGLAFMVIAFPAALIREYRWKQAQKQRGKQSTPPTLEGQSE